MKKISSNRTKSAAAQQTRFVAWARVQAASRSAKVFSLDVQVNALNAYAERAGGKVGKLYRVAETASKSDERKTFREMVEYVKQNAETLDGMLFYKVDRAARNLFDYVELEKLESAYCVPLIVVSQPTENTPAGRMQRRMLASMASFYTEQQSLDVKEGLARRETRAIIRASDSTRMRRMTGWSTSSTNSVSPTGCANGSHTSCSRTPTPTKPSRASVPTNFSGNLLSFVSRKMNC